MEDTLNGAKLLLEDIETELENRRLSRKDRLMLRSHKYMLESLSPIREDVSALKRHDVVGWAKKNPRSAALFAVGILAVNSMVNWSGIRKPALQAIIHVTTGIMIPLDALP